MRSCLQITAILLTGIYSTVALGQTSKPSKTAASKSTTTQKVNGVEDRSSRSTAKSKGDINFDDIKFDIEKGGKFERKMLTKDIEGFHKKNITIRGYILPASVFKQSGIEEFVLVRDNMECCFGPGAALYDCIIIQMAKGKTAKFTTRPVAVKGKFEIQEFKYPDSEEHYAIYKMTATEVK
ncbi:MAG: DUF3299 domain-containing protein [Planctomycetota bacterium]